MKTSTLLLALAASFAPLAQAAVTFDFAITGGSSPNNSTGPGGNVNVDHATVATITPVIGGIQLTLTALSGSGTPTISANDQGFGVSTDGEGGAAGTRLQGGAKAESMHISFDKDVTLDSMRFGSFGNGEVVRLSFVSGVNPFTSGDFLTITGTGAQGPATDIFLATDPIVSGGIGVIHAGTVLSITVSGGDSAVLINEFTVSEASGNNNVVTIIAAIPTPVVTQNPDSGATQGALEVAAGGAMGQSFSLPAAANVTGFVFQCAGVAATGGFTLKLHRAMDHRPWMLTPAAVVTASLPEVLEEGDLFQINLPAPLDLARGSHIVTLEGAGATAFSLATSEAALYPTGAATRFEAGEWQLLANPQADLVFAVLGTQSTPPPVPTGKPNLLFIMADDLSWTDIQCGPTGPNVVGGANHGSGFHQTPNIARLAHEGLSFTHAYMHPNCAPTRAALLSGQYPARSGNGVYVVGGLNRGRTITPYVGPEQNQDIPASHVIWSEALQAAGYVTAHLGKYHVTGHETGTETAPENQGFDFNFGGNSAGNPGSYFATDGVWHNNIGPGLAAFAAPYTQAYVDANLKGPAADPLHTRALTMPALYPNAAANNPDTLVGTQKHVTDAVGDAATAFIRDHTSGSLAERPFLLQVHFYAPHTPTQPRPDLAAKYQTIPTTTNHKNRNYAGLVEGLDQNLGRILDRLDDPNGDGDTSDSIAANTLVILVSDNGGQAPTENNPLRHRKGSFYSGGIRIPMIVRQPGVVPAATQTRTLVHAVDFYPTLLGHAGVPMPSGITFDGASFASHITDPVAHPRERSPLYYHFPGYLDTRARPCNVVIARSNGETYKLLYHYDTEYTGNPGSAEDLAEGLFVLDHPWELYNLDRDISETNNLLDGRYSNHLLYGTLADTLAAGLLAWLDQDSPDWSKDKLTERATGALVDFPPADVPDVVVPFDQVFRITDSVLGESPFTLTWNSETGFRYRILAADSPDGPWNPIGETITATGATTTRTFPDPAAPDAPHRFYRVALTDET